MVLVDLAELVDLALGFVIGWANSAEALNSTRVTTRKEVDKNEWDLNLGMGNSPFSPSISKPAAKV